MLWHSRSLTAGLFNGLTIIIVLDLEKEAADVRRALLFVLEGTAAVLTFFLSPFFAAPALPFMVDLPTHSGPSDVWIDSEYWSCRRIPGLELYLL